MTTTTPFRSPLGKAAAPLLLLLALVALAFAVFSPLLSAPFLYDDESVIVHDPSIADAASPDAAPVPLFRNLWRMPRPFRQFSHRLDARLFGPGPRPAHAVNIILHASAAFAAALLLLSLGFPISRAAFAAFVFLLAPVTLESVGIVSHRKEILSALLLFLGLALPPRLRFAPLAALFFVLAALAKETALVFPALLLVVALARRTSPRPPRVSSVPRWLAPAWLAFAALLALLLYAQARASMSFLHSAPSLDPHRPGHFGPGVPWSLPVSAALRAFPWFLRAIADPFVARSIDPPFPLDVPLASPAAALALLPAVLFLAALWFLRRTRFFPPLLWIAAALAPYLFPPLLRSGGTAAVADRYAYLASFGFAWLLAAAPPFPVPRHPAAASRLRRTLLPALAAAFLLLLAFSTRRLALPYVTNVDFWSRAVALNPSSAPTHCNLAHAFWEERRDRDSAAAEYDRMTALAPDFLFGIVARTDFLADSGDPAAADAALSEALLHPLPDRERTIVVLNRASLRLETARWDDALADFETARGLGADDPAFHRGFAEALKRTLRWDDARREISLAAEADPAFLPDLDDFRLFLDDPPLRPSRTVLLLGDSVPRGTHSALPGEPERSLADRLSALRPDLSFLDETLPGSTARGLSRAFPHVLRRHPDAAWCLLMTGHNDAFAGASPREILYHLSGCVADARRAGVRPLVLGPIPVRSTPDRDRTAQEAALAELDRLLADFCASARVPFLSTRDCLDKSDAAVSTFLVVNDGNHLSAEGLDALAVCAIQLCPEP